MKRFLTVAVAMLALTGMGQVAMRKLEDLTNTNLVCVTDYGPQVDATTAALAVHTNRADNPHGVTAVQIGALTAEVDPVAGPRLDLIEPETNKWNAAYAWGDHALAGYLTNETDEIALAVMATNRTTVVFNPTNSNEFTDGAMRVWRISTVTNTFIGWSVVIETPISICGEVIQPSTNQWPGIPYPLWTNSALSFTQFITNYPAGSTQPMVVWYYYRTGSGSPHEVYFSSPAEESDASWVSNYQSASATNSVRVLFGRDDLSPTWSDPVYMVYGTNTTVSVVTSQVATVAWQSDLTPYATTAALAVHTNRTDNPHGVTAVQIGALTAEQDLAALRAYHYGSPDIVESPAEWFVFDGAGTITAFNWSAGRENVVIPWEIGGVPVTAIGVRAFQGSGIVSVIAPQTVTAIGDYAFNSCYSLSSVSLPQVQTVGVRAFDNCISLTSVSLPQVTAIGDCAFYNCISLASVNLPQAQTVGVRAFADCDSLASVNLPQVTAIGDYAFAGCAGLTSVTIPQATSIGDYAFAGCAGLTSVHMGQNAPAEATGVFYGIATPPNVYVTNPNATGWGDTWNGAPVVRPPLYGSNVTAQAFTLGGDTITEWPSGGGGATNITDGVTSGTYSEATRTIDISNLLAGVSVELPDGIVTNGGTYAGPFTLGSCQVAVDGSVGIGGAAPTIAKARVQIFGNMFFADTDFGGMSTKAVTLRVDEGYDAFRFGMPGVRSYDFTGSFNGFSFGDSTSGTSVPLFDVYGNHSTRTYGNAVIDGTNTAAEVRSTGGYIIGPTISGKQAHIFTDGTNCFFVNVNSVTNGGSVPYTAWTGTVTPQNGTATVAYAHGNMPVLVVPDGGGTTYVTVATGTYAATSGVSRVSLSIWAGTNTIELVTNEVDYATAPDIPTNGWGTILFRRVSNGRWKGVGL